MSGAQRPPPRRLPAAGALLALLLGVLAAACGGPQWHVQDGTCVLEQEDGPVRRIINRTDPELCGRSGKDRSTVYVRVQPPPGMRSR